MADFEKELESFISESADISHLVGELGGNGKEEVVAMAEVTDSLSQIKSSLYPRHHAEVRNEGRGPSPRLGAWATQLRKNTAVVASRWRHYIRFEPPGNEPKTLAPIVVSYPPAVYLCWCFLAFFGLREAPDISTKPSLCFMLVYFTRLWKICRNSAKA